MKKEGGVPEGPVLESLLSGEPLDKKVETKEEEAMSECQVSDSGDFYMWTSVHVKFYTPTESYLRGH